jgi:hypothetical protein
MGGILRHRVARLSPAMDERAQKMVNISIEDGVVVFTVQGLHKILALRSRLEIPISHVRGVRADPNIGRRWWKGFRLGGTHLPGLLAAGTFYTGGQRTFWDVSNPGRAIVVDLTDERFKQLIVEVEDPAAEVARFEKLAGQDRTPLDPP